jgi:membrane-bound lytic murein transglycosylase D
MSLRRAIWLVLAACVSTPAAATATSPLPTFLAPAQVPAPPPHEPLVPLPITTPVPTEQPPAAGTTVAPELVPPPVTQAGSAPIPPADTAAPAPAKPTLAMTSGNELFARLRADLSPNNCDAGANSARWRERYAGHPAAFSRRLETVLPLIDFVSAEVDRAGLPAEFTFIPLVESWYQPGAIGPGGPAGMWQMIASTAKNHGIHIREGYDGRLSPVESTRAALSYLKVLQDMFGDWQAIVMAYNAGEGRMQQAMRRAGSRVTNAAQRRPHGLSNITYDYVDKLQALSCLVSQPQRFNLHLPVDTRYEPLVPLLMDPGVDTLDQFARARGKDAGELRRLNPGFRNGRIIAGVPRLVLAPPGASVPPVAVATAPAPSQDLLAFADSDPGEIADLLDSALAVDASEYEPAPPACGR